MNFVTDIETLVADLKARDWAKSAKDAGQLISDFGDVISHFQNGGTGPTPPVMGAGQPLDTARLNAARDSLVAECNACQSQPHAMRAGAGSIDPATILAIIQGVIQLVDWFRTRHQQTP